MLAPFVPLSVPASYRVMEGSTARLTVLSADEAAKVFKPFTSAATVVGATTTGNSHRDHSDPPKITLHREDGRVTQIIVECGCGERIELACEY